MMKGIAAKIDSRHIECKQAIYFSPILEATAGAGLHMCILFEPYSLLKFL